MPPGFVESLFVNLDVRRERETRKMSSIMTVESSAVLDDELDLVEEMRLRTWARKNYVEASERDATWHPVIRDEMARIDNETLTA